MGSTPHNITETRMVDTLGHRRLSMLKLLTRKLLTFCNSPTGSVKEKITDGIPAAIRNHGRKKLGETSVIESIAEFHAKRESSAFGPDYGDLWFLYHNVRKRRPRTILEFGSGISTVCLAQALFDNGFGTLYSVDGNKNWAASTARCLPGHLKPFCEVRHSEILETNYAGTPVLKHANVPEVIPNFAYLDGPEGVWAERPAAIDLLEMEPDFPTAFFLVVDERESNTQFLRKHFKRQYRFRHRKIARQPTFELLA